MILVQDVIGTVSPVEILWLITAVIGLGVSHLNGWEAMLDLRALAGKRNGRRRIAVGTVRREAVAGIVNAIFLGIGIVAALSPANPSTTPLGVAVSLGLLMASGALNLNSYLDRRDRLYLMENGMQPRDEQGRFVKD